ncbi:MAG: YgfZ/GcvT domain-containing protein [Actinomycetes bacterium]
MSSLDRSDAIRPPEGAPDQGIAWHYGDPHREQRALMEGRGVVDLSNRGVITVSGADRISWLHTLTSQHVENLQPGQSALALILSPNGHVEHELHIVDDGTSSWLIVEPGTQDELVDYLRKMQFMLRVEVADVSDEYVVVWESCRDLDADYPTYLVPEAFAVRGFSGREVIIPRAELDARLASAEIVAGTWALEALRAAAGVPRLRFETDHRTIPHEVGWIGPAVHLQKGCYRGQETVARVQNLGKPPRRLAILHVDGSAEIAPLHCDRVFYQDKEIGWVGTGARHHELGPVATAILKRNVPVDAELIIRTAEGDVSASQEVVVSAD